MLEVLIVADDLTGAADCGGACAALGLDTVVVLEEAGGIPAAQVVAIDANTRCMTPEQAAAETARIIRQYPARIVYKKIDSTLRGNVGSEIAAALEAYRSMGHPDAVAVVAPAFPAMGRTARNGRMYVRGALLDAECAGLNDAETEDDLRAIVKRWSGREVLWVGSAGLMRCLAEAMAVDRRELPAWLRADGPIVIAVGSLSERSREQVEVLEATGLEGDMLLTGEAQAVAAAVARVERIGALVLTGGDTARAVLTKLGIAALRVASEVEMGVPIMVAEGSGVPVVTKAGDFGNRETLVKCRAALRESTIQRGRFQ